MDVDEKATVNPRPLVLYIWPHAWSLPSTDAHSIAALLFLHQHFPGKYSIVECSDPDLSPSGTLPFLAHYVHAVAPLAEIVAYLSTLDPITLTPTRGVTVDQGLTPHEKQETVAWKAYMDSNLGNLLSLVLYADLPNYLQLTRPALARHMPFPTRYYVPARLRKEHTGKLERLGWGVAEAEVEEETRNHPAHRGGGPGELRRAFEGEKHKERAGPILDDLARLLGSREYIFQDRPTLLDIYLASYLSLLTLPPFPDNHISGLIRASHSALFTHTHRILALLPQARETLPFLPSPQPALLAPLTRTLSSIPLLLPLLKARVKKPTDSKLTEAESEAAAEQMADSGRFSLGNILYGSLALGTLFAVAVARGWVNPSLPDVDVDAGEDFLTEGMFDTPGNAEIEVVIEEVTLGTTE
ncbi:hypothetical protein CALVIDRAFT_535958 [Calocera viscosa TUFC12733]|uniref:Mitochondrial outer membrane transport complex Sam37/metaxin N-terminal domain-containing protein n=1 Tax=Calocera viscosa (strain TUFC12733) TaxID=1330018 RepID=A0A167NM78_CALVF|nr:hypothetical protein CALVIDRAFT_535958 [Calocera viscosa TUFC12733]